MPEKSYIQKRRFTVLFITVCFLLLILSDCSKKYNKYNNERGAEWHLLFNGKDLTGWELAKKGKWIVENGELVGMWDPDNPGGGWIITKDHFENFYLSLKFKVPAKTNSGIAIRYNSRGEMDPAFYGYEIQIYNYPEAHNATGAIYQIANSYYKNIKDDDWNKVDISAVGDHIKVSINGEKVSEVHDRRSFKGAIGFQTHDQKTKIRLKDIKIQTLSPTPNIGVAIEDYMSHTWRGEEKNLFNGKDLTGWAKIGEGRWTIKNGVIIGSKSGREGSWLVTKDNYKNFFLKLKFKVENNNNSGVWIRYSPSKPDELPDLNNSNEIQIYESNDPTFENPSGSIVGIARAYPGEVSFEDWNLMEIYTWDDHICVYLNGHKAGEGHIERVSEGKIALQVGRTLDKNQPSSVQFKDIVIKSFKGGYIGQ